MKKFSLRFDKDKETTWLNEMAAKGWAMTSFCAGVYTFEECNPGEYAYQIDIQDSLFSVKDDYREFMSDAGIEIVQVWGYWVILRKKASEGAFELFTDVDSQIEHYKKILKLFKVVSILEMICFMIEVFSAASSNSIAVWGFVCLIAAFTIVLLSMVVKTKNVIMELEERKTGIASTKRRTASPILLAGLLVNSVALLANDSVSDYILIPIRILAIVLMLIGIVQTCANRKNVE